MVRVTRRDVEPEPEPRRHPVATWRQHEGPTRVRHPFVVLPTTEVGLPMRQHRAGQHSRDIVYGASQTSCWLRCTVCDCTSPRILYQYVGCVRCATRRNSTQPTWAILAQCVWVNWGRVLLRLFWMGLDDASNYFADTIAELNQRRRFVDVVETDGQDQCHEVYEQNPCNTQGPCPSKPFEGLEQCLSWHRRVGTLVRRGYSWLRPKLLQEEYPTEATP